MAKFEVFQKIKRKLSKKKSDNISDESKIMLTKCDDDVYGLNGMNNDKIDVGIVSETDSESNNIHDNRYFSENSGDGMDVKYEDVYNRYKMIPQNYDDLKYDSNDSLKPLSFSSQMSTKKRVNKKKSRFKMRLRKHEPNIMNHKIHNNSMSTLSNNIENDTNVFNFHDNNNLSYYSKIIQDQFYADSIESETKEMDLSDIITHDNGIYNSYLMRNITYNDDGLLLKILIFMDILFKIIENIILYIYINWRSDLNKIIQFTYELCGIDDWKNRASWKNRAKIIYSESIHKHKFYTVNKSNFSQSHVNLLQPKLGKCPNCLIYNKNMILQCGHMVSCHKCVNLLRICPVCKELITTKPIQFAGTY